MAKILYLDCGMGAAGDMLAAALYELLEENEKTAFLEQMNEAGLPGVSLSAEKAAKCGIVGTHMKVTVNGMEEGEEAHAQEAGHTHSNEAGHTHSHGAGHTHSHHHSGMRDIVHIIESLSISEQVKEHAIAIYGLIAEAESHAHGRPVSDIHFHEVGSMDAIADVTAVSLLLETLGVKKIMASNVHVGSGQVHCAHGLMPVPAPATAYLLKDVPIYGGSVKGELCTPTGAALLKHFVSDFGDMPVMKMEKIGYGMGKKDFEAANCVRALLGEAQLNQKNKVVELSCNIDDMTPERVSFAMEQLFMQGALEVYTVPVGMKKSRMGILLCVLCELEKKDAMLRLIFKHTTTLGIRETISHRYTLSRGIESMETVFGNVRVKYAKGYGVAKQKYEYDDISKIAAKNGLSIDEVLDQIGDKH